jgi:CheY-like chemotaxis protein
MSEKKRILLVDHDAAFVASQEAWLKQNGYAVLVATDGAGALATAKAEKPDLMVLEIMLATETEGIEISRQIAEIPELKSMPVMIVTGLRKAWNLTCSLEPDANWLPVRIVLEKPVPPDVMLQEIQRLLP